MVEGRELDGNWLTASKCGFIIKLVCGNGCELLQVKIMSTIRPRIRW